MKTATIITSITSITRPLGAICPSLPFLFFILMLLSFLLLSTNQAMASGKKRDLTSMTDLPTGSLITGESTDQDQVDVPQSVKKRIKSLAPTGNGSSSKQNHREALLSLDPASTLPSQSPDMSALHSLPATLPASASQPDPQQTRRIKAEDYCHSIKADWKPSKTSKKTGHKYGSGQVAKYGKSSDGNRERWLLVRSSTLSSEKETAEEELLSAATCRLELIPESDNEICLDVSRLNHTEKDIFKGYIKKHKLLVIHEGIHTRYYQYQYQENSSTEDKWHCIMMNEPFTLGKNKKHSHPRLNLVPSSAYNEIMSPPHYQSETGETLVSVDPLVNTVVPVLNPYLNPQLQQAVMELVDVSNAELKKEIKKLEERLEESEERRQTERKQWQSTITEFGAQLQQVQLVTNDLQSQTAKSKHHGVNTSDITHFEGNIRSLQNSFDVLARQIDAINVKMEENSEEVGVLQTAMDQCTKAITQVNGMVNEVGLKVDILAVRSVNGILIWKVNEIEKRIEEAKTGKILSLYSPPFFTSLHGYRMCLRLYLDGDGQGKGSHVSLFLVIMKSDYDDLLTWPFKQKVTLYLLNQQDPYNTKAHIAQAFRPTETSTSFQKPRGPFNTASGFPKFFPIEKLRDRNFVQDDCMYFKVKIDMTDVKAPDYPAY